MATETLLTQTTDNQPEVENQPPKSNETAPKPPESKPTVFGDWRDAVDPAIRGEKMFENIKGKDAAEVLPVLARGYHDAQKLVGGSLGKLPAKGAAPAEVEKWKTDNLPKLAEAGLIDAAPATPDKYTAKIIRDGAALDADLAPVYAQFHKLGLTDKQAQGMLDLYTEQTAQVGGTVKDTMKVLEKEWGAGVQAQLDLGRLAVRKLGGEELVEFLDNSGLGNHPALIKAFVRAGSMLGEDDPVFKDVVHSGVGEARAKRDAILKDPKHDYWHGNGAAHKAAVAEVSRLNQIIFAQEG